MKDYRLVCAYALVILAFGFLVRSITNAYAYPAGPSVSSGEHPVFSVSTLSHTGTIFTNQTNFTAVITDIFVENTATGGYCRMKFDVSNGGDSFMASSYFYGGSPISNLSSGIKVPPGASITTSVNTGSYCGGAALSGYYAHHP